MYIYIEKEQDIKEQAGKGKEHGSRSRMRRSRREGIKKKGEIRKGKKDSEERRSRRIRCIKRCN